MPERIQLNNLNGASSFSLLLVEPYFVLRRTVASVAGGLGGVAVREAPTLDAAGQLLSFQRFDGFVMSLDGHDRKGVLDLIGSIRGGGTPSPKDACVAVTTERCDADTVAHLRELGVQRILIKPFKVKTVLETVSAFSSLAGGKLPTQHEAEGKAAAP